MRENDILSRQVSEAIADAKKLQGEVSDLYRERDKVHDRVAEVNANTQEGRDEILKMARFEVTNFLDKSEKFEQMLDKLGMSYDKFVEHELKELDAGTKEGRQQMLSMAQVEMRDHGDSARFRDMLDKAGASYQEFQHYKKTGEMYGNPKQKEAFNPSFGSASSEAKWDARIKASELEHDLKEGRELAAKNRLKELEEIRKKEEKRKEEEKKKKEEEKKKK